MLNYYVCVCATSWITVLGSEKMSGHLFWANFLLNRFLREMIDIYILTPEIVPRLLLAARTTLFPFNARPTAVNNAATNNDKAAQSVTGNVDANSETAQSKTASAPSASEISAIERQCATDILSLFPRSIAQYFFLSPDHHHVDDDDEGLLEAIESDLLDPFSDAYCNKHLIFAVIESVLVKLLPELSERGITDLMEERGVVFSS